MVWAKQLFNFGVILAGNKMNKQNVYSAGEKNVVMMLRLCIIYLLIGFFFITTCSIYIFATTRYETVIRRTWKKKLHRFHFGLLRRSLEPNIFYFRAWKIVHFIDLNFSNSEDLSKTIAYTIYMQSKAIDLFVWEVN